MWACMTETTYLELKQRMRKTLNKLKKESKANSSKPKAKKKVDATAPDYALDPCLCLDELEASQNVKGKVQLSSQSEAGQFSLVIPTWGLSTNSMYVSTGNKSKPRVKSPAYRAYIKHVNELITEAYGLNPPSFPADVKVEFKVLAQTKRKNRDVDNLCKPLQDILVKRGILSDDKQVYRNVLEKFDGEFDEVRVYLTPLKRTHSYSDAYKNV